ncbi:ABC-type multidrug transport system ATPase subunit/pSer/pThr/pTyr-binding forkhead associated (FHA) protein/ABC-type multidrug transport system permease subunit [Aequitasia blattaphilus]|uniref:ATP-binding cassette domain-containing protein n=1 Tax=Aequitasia blattaphilus TaxID=2949332 RepID=A0ABT1E5X9_9FIRM|nr:FHA domain-containing protein [Aequitasia blattaphilus]MCP1101245.1 ATP-binding cassette domain-containing protein [Aequitasia blattaphilus]MCR8613885.1 ATP-binding cassette domain-containing protein [Aequitasia blattaphilus]
MEMTHNLTIIDSQGTITEYNLGEHGKENLVVGRNSNVCDIVIPDEMVSKCQGDFYISGDKVYYRDNDSSNGTYLENYSERILLNKAYGYVELVNNTILKIGNLKNPDYMVLLIYNELQGENTWYYSELDQGSVTIGRGKGNSVQFSNPGVSRNHCIIEKRGEHFYLSDLGSANGTLLNGFVINGVTPLYDKDVIQILDQQIIYTRNAIFYLNRQEGLGIKALQLTKVVKNGRGSQPKAIINDVSLEIKPNEFVAIVGGSGAGKSSIMNLISGFDKEFEGKVYVNGTNLISRFQELKSLIGFVPQEEILYENLTLYKMLYYAAKLKMPDDTSTEEIEERIDLVLETINMTIHKDTCIRKLSGGQKKRASIAVELLADPKLFFLDEPTSGLDPGTEKKLMETLSALSKSQNKTIIMVTHTTQNIDLCDRVIFMGSGGRLCFSGTPMEARTFFKTSDFVDIYNILEENTDGWAEYFAQSQNQADLTEIRGGEESSGKSQGKTRKNSGLRQYGILFTRSMDLLFQDKARLMLLVLQPIIIAILLKVVSEKDVFSIYEPTKSILFALCCSGIWIGIFNSIQEVCKERAMVRREYMGNLRLPAYVGAKFSLLVILCLIQALLLTCIFLLLVGKNKEGIFFDNLFVEMSLTMWITVLTASAIGLLVSSMVRNADKAMVIAPFILIVQLIFSGILFKLKGVGDIISKITISRWAVEDLGSIANLNKMDLKMQKDFPMLTHKAEKFFEHTAKHLVVNWSVLIGMALVCVVLSMIVLRRVSKDRR